MADTASGSDENQQKNKINLELSEEVAEGTYANLAIITHSHSEFIADFARMLPGVSKARVKSRVILTPQHAKRLLRALQDNIQKYENQYGAISEPGEGEDSEKPMFPMNFGGPTPQA
jgi:ribonuclease BN (tRNA processing enzyme)